MAIELAPTARGILIASAVVLAILTWMKTTGSLLTLAVIIVVVAVLTLLLWGAGTRIVRRVAGVR